MDLKRLGIFDRTTKFLGKVRTSYTRNVLVKAVYAYVLSAILVFAANLLLILSEDNLWAVLKIGGLILVLLAIFILAYFLYATWQINRERDRKKIDRVRFGAIEIDASAPIIDNIFLVFAGWKIGDFLSELLDSQTAKNANQITFDFSLLIFSMMALIYSFSKAYDKMKEHHGVRLNMPQIRSPLEYISWHKKLKLDICRFLVVLLLFVVVPMGFGLFF